MKILVDAFGGDNAPLSVLEGCAQAVAELGASIILVGDRARIEAAAKEHNIPMTGMEIAHAPHVMPVEEDPAQLRGEYKHSSMAVGCQMLADGAGDAFVSAGSTGALLVGASVIVKRLKGIKRCALATVIPNQTGTYLLIDAGANSECRPEMLKQFGVMGSVYMEKIQGVKNPRVGMVNIGAEENKGTPLQVEANLLLQEAGINFIGNVEAREVPLGGCDVAVCDGFTGNVMLKLTEGLAKMFVNQLKGMFMSSAATKVAALLMKGQMKLFKKQLDSSEHGGAPLLGARKPVIKAHGNSDGKAIKNAVRQAMRCVQEDVVGEIGRSLAAYSQELETAPDTTEE